MNPRAVRLALVVGPAVFLWAHLVAHDIPSREYWNQFRTAEELAAMNPVTGPPPAAAANPTDDQLCGQADIAAVLATIRKHESNGNYRVDNSAGASGAYQFIQSTWDAVAKRAGRTELVGRRPSSVAPADQDAVARQHVSEAINVGVENVPAVWYVGHVPTSEREWNTVPRPDAGNRLTVRQYQNLWLDTYRKAAGPCPGGAI